MTLLDELFAALSATSIGLAILCVWRLVSARDADEDDYRDEDVL